MQEPSNTDVYTVAAGEDRILTELTLGDKTVALDANTTALYVVGTPSSDLTVTVKNATVTPTTLSFPLVRLSPT